MLCLFWPAQESSKPHVLLVHPISATIPIMYKALSQRFSVGHAFGYIRDADQKLKDALGFEVAKGAKPKVLTWKAGASISEFEVYDGACPLSLYYLNLLD